MLNIEKPRFAFISESKQISQILTEIELKLHHELSEKLKTASELGANYEREFRFFFQYSSEFSHLQLAHFPS